MKKIFILFLSLVVGNVFSQTNISPFPEDFGVGSNIGAITSFTASADWILDDASSAPTIPVCNVGGSSGGSKLFGASSSTGVIQEVGTIGINTGTFVNIQVSWNELKKNPTLSPALTIQWTRDAGATWNTLSYSPPTGTNTWGIVSPISLPATANGTIIAFRWSYTSNGGGGLNYVAIDDVKITGTPSPSYYWNGVNNITLVSSWGTNTNGTGANPPDFISANQNFYVQNAASVTLPAAWTFSGSSSFLNIGDGTNGNKCNLTIPAGFALTMGTGAILNVTNLSTLTILNSSFPSLTNVNISNNSTIEFGQSGAATLWGTTYGHLTISGSGTKSQPGQNLTVLGNFNIAANCFYQMTSSGTRTTRLSGPIACTGSITTAVSHLAIDGAGSIGTLNFGGAGDVNDFTLNRASELVTLGNNFSVNGIASLTNGSISINGRSLSFFSDITFPASSANGIINGSATSSLEIDGSGTISNNLILGAGASSSLSLLIMNKTGATLGLGSDVIVINSAMLTSGNVSLNGRHLNLRGNVEFPAAAVDGSLIGSASSSLTVAGNPTTTVIGSMYMDQTTSLSRSLGSFILSLANTSAVFSLGNNLIVSGPASLSNGIVDLNGTLLTLNGNITFPTNIVGKGFRGSMTSSLSIGGSGNLTNSLLMAQTSAAFRTLSELTMNRGARTLVIGNALEVYGTVYPTAGTINSQVAANLFIRSNTTTKGSIGVVGGLVTGNVRVETFATGGATDWTNLGVSGVIGKTFADWDGQIPMTCEGCINDEVSAGGYFVSIQGWDETAVASSSLAYIEKEATDPLNTGEGYWVFLGDNLGTTSDITWTVQGNVVQGLQSIPLSFSGAGNGDGYNLISNPFPAPISWESVLANPVNAANIDLGGAIYVYNPDSGPTSYVAGVGSFGGGITDTIPMGQGFYVQVTNATNIEIEELNKVRSDAPLLKTANTNIGSVVRLRVDGGGFSDGTAIRFHSDATSNFDKKLDAHKLFSSPGYLGYPGAYTQRTTISTKAGNEDYSINSLPYAQSADAVIPVLVKVYATGQHTITGSEFENLPNSCVILKDKLLNTTHDLKTGGYVCTINDTTSAPRFELRVCMDISMSIDEPKEEILNKSVLISNDLNGVYVKFDYDKATKSTISVTNILGQKVIDDKSLTTVNDKVYLNLDPKQQLVFITVSSDDQKVTKKVIR